MKRCHAHVERRNGVVYGNRDWPGWAESHDSIDATERLIADIEQVQMRGRARLAIESAATAVVPLPLR